MNEKNLLKESQVQRKGTHGNKGPGLAFLLLALMVSFFVCFWHCVSGINCTSLKMMSVRFLERTDGFFHLQK